ncbi:MAG: HTH domain-containing protein, partial [Erysipelotrichaceae bacterium]
MKNRKEKIIQILNNTNDWVTGKTLAKMLNVSDRTIRTDIESINIEYHKLIESSVRYGYKLSERKYDHDFLLDIVTPQNASERNRYIIRSLLLARNKVNILKLESEIYYSEFTIRSDLKKLKHELKDNYNLDIVLENNDVYLEGLEEDKRLLYKDCLTDETQGNFINISKIDELFPNIDLIDIKNIFEKIIINKNYLLREETIPLLMIHVGVAIERMNNQAYIVSNKEINDVKGLKEYEISKEFFNSIKKYINYEINDNEIVLFSILLMGRKITNGDNIENAY